MPETQERARVAIPPSIVQLDYEDALQHPDQDAPCLCYDPSDETYWAAEELGWTGDRALAKDSPLREVLEQDEAGLAYIYEILPPRPWAVAPRIPAEIAVLTAAEAVVAPTPVPIPEAVEVLTNEQVYAARRQERDALVLHKASGGYFTNNWRSYTPNRSEAGVFRMPETWGRGSLGDTYELLPDHPWPGEAGYVAPPPPKRIHKLLSRQVLELAKVAPKNPAVRGFLLKATKQMPPDELDTYDKLVDWVEALPVPAEPEKPKVEARGISISVDYLETVRGTCRYERTRSGMHNVGLDFECLSEHAESAGDWDDFYEGARESLGNVAIDDYPDMDFYDETPDGHSHYQDGDNDGASTDWNNSDLARLLTVWLKEFHPVKAEEWGV